MMILMLFYPHVIKCQVVLHIYATSISFEIIETLLKNLIICLSAEGAKNVSWLWVSLI